MYKVRIPAIVKLAFKSIILPIVVVVLLNCFNLFVYITIIPEEYRYEVGLTVYLAVAEAVYGFIGNFIEKKRAHVRCTFYLSEADKDINNNPAIVCDSNGLGVATLNCQFEISGNLKRLRKCKVYMELPEWLSSQVSSSDIVLDYSMNKLKWGFSRLLPETGLNGQTAKYRNKISFIRTTSESNLSIVLKPQLDKCFGVSFETNYIKVQNGE